MDKLKFGTYDMILCSHDYLVGEIVVYSGVNWFTYRLFVNYYYRISVNYYSPVYLRSSAIPYVIV